MDPTDIGLEDFFNDFDIDNILQNGDFMAENSFVDNTFPDILSSEMWSEGDMVEALPPDGSDSDSGFSGKSSGTQLWMKQSHNASEGGSLKYFAGLTNRPEPPSLGNTMLMFAQNKSSSTSSGLTPSSVLSGSNITKTPDGAIMCIPQLKTLTTANGIKAIIIPNKSATAAGCNNKTLLSGGVVVGGGAAGVQATLASSQAGGGRVIKVVNSKALEQRAMCQLASVPELYDISLNNGTTSSHNNSGSTNVSIDVRTPCFSSLLPSSDALTGKSSMDSSGGSSSHAALRHSSHFLLTDNNSMNGNSNHNNNLGVNSTPVKIQPKYPSTFNYLQLTTSFSDSLSSSTSSSCNKGLTTHYNNNSERTTTAASLFSTPHHSTTTTGGLHHHSNSLSTTMHHHAYPSAKVPISVADNSSPVQYSTDTHHFEKLVKRQEKMIKNRHAASLSRQRKKEYLERLERKLEELREENNILRHQNLEWQTRYLELESTFKDRDRESVAIKRESELEANGGGSDSCGGKILSPKQHKTLRFSPLSSIGNNNRASRTAMATSSVFLCVACLFLFSFWNFNPFLTQPKSVLGRLSQAATLPLSFNPSSQAHVSRTLLDYSSNSNDVSPEDNSTRLAQCLQQLRHQSHWNGSSGFDANDGGGNQQHIWPNSSRLSMELNDVLTRHDVASRRAFYLHKQKHAERSGSSGAQENSVPAAAAAPSIPRAHIVTAEEMETPRLPKRKFKSNDVDVTQVQVYNPQTDPHLDHFVPASERENDTLYLVSLTHNHIIYPATIDSSNLSRPKMTFVIPTQVGLFDSPRPADNKLTMMHIHCEVTNFTITQVDKWKFPYLYRNPDWSLFKH